MSETYDYDNASIAHHNLCRATVKRLAKLRKQDRGAFDREVEDEVLKLMGSKLRVAAGLARSIMLDPDPLLDATRRASIEEFAAFNRVLAYYGEREVAL